MINKVKNTLLQSKSGRPFLADVCWQDDGKQKPVVIFSHGFKGFKDWGAFNEAAALFARKGIVLVKFNFSHNGTTIDHPLDFADLEAFGNNNFGIELDDLTTVLDWVCSGDFPVPPAEFDIERISLLGHSRGGGISILKAREDDRVKRLCTWASVNEFGKFWKPDEMERIKREGVLFVPNARTQQMMPIRWQMYAHYFAHKDRLFIPDAVKQLNIPFLIIHGTDDETVPYTAAIEMQQWNKIAELLLLEHANHTFGMKHPFTDTALPEDFQDVCEATIDFFKRKP